MIQLDDLKLAFQHANASKGMQASGDTVNDEGLNSLALAGLTPLQMVILVIQYGPEVLAFIIKVIKDLKAGSFSWETWQAEFAKYGADVMAFIQKIIAALNVVVPPAPPVVMP